MAKRLALLAALLLLGSAPARAYETLPSDEFPSPAWLESTALEQALLPELDSALLRRADYTETTNDGQPYGLLSLRAASPAYLSLLHYTADRRCIVLRRALPLPARQNVTLSFELPARGGLTRLLVWDGEPEVRTLARLAQYPNHTEPATGVLAQRWLPRTRAAALARPPWVDPQVGADTLGGEAFGTALIRGWPLLAAQLGADMRVRTKDCTVLYTGIERIAIGERGTRAVWTLSSAERLELRFELPHRTPSRALLLLDRAIADGAAGSVELRVNGSLATGSAGRSSPGQTAADGWDVARYLREGLNSIELRAAGFMGDAEVSRIELWAD